MTKVTIKIPVLILCAMLLCMFMAGFLTCNFLYRMSGLTGDLTSGHVPYTDGGLLKDVK